MRGQCIDLPPVSAPWLYAVASPTTTVNEQPISLSRCLWLRPNLHDFGFGEGPEACWLSNARIGPMIYDIFRPNLGGLNEWERSWLENFFKGKVDKTINKQKYLFHQKVWNIFDWWVTMTTSVSVNKEASIHFPGIETGFELINICLLFFVAKTLTYREGSLSPLLSLTVAYLYRVPWPTQF